jgi:hypothetical protein
MLRSFWVERLREQLAAHPDDSTETFKFKALTRDEIARWLCTAWDALSTSAVVGGFRKAGMLLSTASFSEDSETTYAIDGIDALLSQLRLAGAKGDDSGDLIEHSQDILAADVVVL